jgi:hypothetical protein
MRVIQIALSLDESVHSFSKVHLYLFLKDRAIRASRSCSLTELFIR